MTGYLPNIPTGSVPLDQDYVNLQNNFSSLNTTYAVNHIPLTIGTNRGKHAFLQLPNTTIGAIPGLVNGDETLYSTAIAGNGELAFTRGGTGIQIQLTGPGVPATTIPMAGQPTGFTFLAGGIILNYGTTGIISGSTNNVTFSKPFSTDVTHVFSITATPGTAVIVAAQKIDNTQFNILVSGTPTIVQWFAIGN